MPSVFISAQHKSIYEITTGDDIDIKELQDSILISFLTKYRHACLDSVLSSHYHLKYLSDTIIVIHLNLKKTREYGNCVSYIYLYDKKRKEVHIMHLIPYDNQENITEFKSLCYSNIYDLDGCLKYELYIHPWESYSVLDKNKRRFYSSVFRYYFTINENLYYTRIYEEDGHFFNIKNMNRLCDYTLHGYFKFLEECRKSIDWKFVRRIGKYGKYGKYLQEK